MPVYLFLFGFESPHERGVNAAYGTDDESSCAFFIEADDEPQAVRFGERVAQAYVDWLFTRSNAGPSNWLAGGFYRGLVPDPAAEYDADTLASLPRLTAGSAMPDFETGWPLPE